MRLVDRFLDEWLQSVMDISISDIHQDDNRLFRVAHKTTLFRTFVGLVFILPAFWPLWWISQQPMKEWPLLLVLLLLSVFLIGVGLLLGFSRDEVIICRKHRTVQRTLRFMTMKKSFSATLPEHGRIRLWREYDDGDSACWWYNIAMTEPQWIVFTISREQDTAERFAERLAAFLSWPLEDQIRLGK